MTAASGSGTSRDESVATGSHAGGADGTAPDLNHWLRIEPAIVAAVECRQALPLHVLDGIAPNAPGSWSLTPARSFTVFGLPVTRIELFIDPDGELGASYTAVIEKRSLERCASN